MILHLKKIYSFLALLVIAYSCEAQDSTKSWHISIGADLTSVPTFIISGTDTSFKNSLSVSPTFSLRNKNGFGITYSPKFVLGGSNPGLYMHFVTVGIEQYNKKKIDLIAEYNHFFITSNSSIPSTPLTNEVYTEITFKKSIIRPMLGLGVGFGADDQKGSSGLVYDVSAEAGIGHRFVKNVKGAEIDFIPSLKVNAGTDEYFSFMYSSKYLSGSKNFNKYIHKKKGSTSPSFSINNVEADLEGSYEKGSFRVQPSAGFVFPVSSTEGSGVSAYWQLSFQYTF
jgi:hypothetical protein